MLQGFRVAVTHSPLSHLMELSARRQLVVTDRVRWTPPWCSGWQPAVGRLRRRQDAFWFWRYHHVVIMAASDVTVSGSQRRECVHVFELSCKRRACCRLHFHQALSVITTQLHETATNRYTFRVFFKCSSRRFSLGRVPKANNLLDWRSSYFTARVLFKLSIILTEWN